MCSCLVLAAAAVGRSIETIEAQEHDGALSAVQAAFVDEGAVQCGFCTPGLVMAVDDLLDRTPDPDRPRDPRGHLREPVPVHRLRPDHRSGPGRGPAAERRGVTDTVATTDTRRPPAPRPGSATSVPRPDGVPKVRGRFAFGSDLWADDALFGRTVRSPHAAARIRSVDVGPALAIAGVYAVLVADDVPGERDVRPRTGPTSPCSPRRSSATRARRSPPSPPTIPRRPGGPRAAVAVDYEPMEPLVDAEAAVDAEPLHPFGNVFRELVIRHGDPDAHGEVVVEGTYEVGMQDQAFMGPESGMAIPAEDGGVDLFVSTQWLHSDRDQVAACLGLPPEKVRLTLAGVGGAFGAREDLSLHVHACLLALRTGRPVRMSYTAGRVLRRPRPPPPGPDALPPRGRRRTAGWSGSTPACSSTAARTSPRPARCWPTPRASPPAPTSCPTP